MIDVIVVGSGASGVNAAYPLVQSGLEVMLLDFGNEDRQYAPLIPPEDFLTIRRGDPDQHRYFLGDEFEGVPFGKVRVGAQLTPSRQHITRDTERLTPLKETQFSPAQSLAVGGLAAGWGAAVAPFCKHELKEWPIGFEQLRPHYDLITERIGISGAEDDIQKFMPRMPGMLPPMEIDANAQSVLERYQAKREGMNEAGFFLGHPRMAMLSREHRGRQGCQYRDMEFWADSDRSVYRPQWTLDQLKRSANFQYVPRRAVLSFAEKPEGGVRITARQAETGELEQIDAKAVVLAGGTLGTARIVLRSLNRYGVRIPILCNPYTYAPLVNLNMLGRTAGNRRHSLSQLCAILKPDAATQGIVMAQFYSYRSLLTFKLMKEAPLPYKHGLPLMRALMPLFGILGIHHEDRPTASKYCLLHRGSGEDADRLEVQYELSGEEQFDQENNERELLRNFRKLRCLPIRIIRPGHGSSIHYGGTFPMSAEPRDLTCDAAGRLAGTQSVYLADGSVFPYLPAKGLTFTMMANADRVGALLAERLKTI